MAISVPTSSTVPAQKGFMPVSGDTAQLSLMFDDEAAARTDEEKVQDTPQPIVKTMLFPRHLSLPHFGQIQRQLASALAPFGIEIEFRFTRQNRLEMKWIFAPEMRRDDIQAFTTLAGMTALTQPAADLTDEEKSAFADIMLEVAD